MPPRQAQAHHVTLGISLNVATHQVVTATLADQLRSPDPYTRAPTLEGLQIPEAQILEMCSLEITESFEISET